MAVLTQDEKDKIRDEGVAQWWSKWWAADYSWEGLAKIDWQGWSVVTNKNTYNAYIKKYGLPSGCPNLACQVIPNDHLDKIPSKAKVESAKLQDYWRDQEGALEREPSSKRQWALPFIPPKWKNGKETWKADFNSNSDECKRLDDIVIDRVKHGEYTNLAVHFISDKVNGQDKRAQFRGCIIGDFPKKSIPLIVHLNFQQTGFLQNLGLKKITFGSASNFIESHFFGHTDFYSAKFTGGNVSFCRAQFSGGQVDFSESQFSGGKVIFYEAQFMGGQVNFHKAHFSKGVTDFRRAQFSGNTFSFGTSFHKTKFSGGNANFNQVKFLNGDSNFHEAEFSGGNALFEYVEFSGGMVDFTRAKFSGGKVLFYKTEFSGGDVYFNEARFSSGIVNFSKTMFSGGNTSFSRAHFIGGLVTFEDGKFSGGCVFFDKVIFFGDGVCFDDVQFYGGENYFSKIIFANKFSFSRSEFNYRVSFTSSEFPKIACDSQGAFRGAVFKHQVDFTNATRLPFNAFDDVEFQRKIILTDDGDSKKSHAVFDDMLESVNSGCIEDKITGGDEDSIAKREHRYGALERGCTSLKLAMEKNSDKIRAQRYFKYELLARQKRPSTKPLTCFMTHMYGLTADYGSSISRPLVSLIAVIAFSAIVYAVNAHLIMHEPVSFAHSAINPLELSLTNTFRPLSIWSNAFLRGEDNWINDYHSSLTAGGWLTIKLIATFQSFFSITMLFLFGLAVKRKFQIK